MTREKQSFMDLCAELFTRVDGNGVTLPDGSRIALFEAPVSGFAAAGDAIFTEFKRPEVIGPGFWTPEEWLPGAKTVASLFFPFTAAVRESNRAAGPDPSAAWLYGRIEGQQFIGAYMAALRDRLSEQGRVCVPSLDERFQVRDVPVEVPGEPPDTHVESRWSERHAAFACGLGTFGLSRGLITRRGMAGRFASVILSRELEPDRRDYTGPYDYCVRCGACVTRCPAGAISLARGKNNDLCRRYVNRMGEKYKPRYGCGKCQTGVPCEDALPGERGRTEGKCPP